MLTLPEVLIQQKTTSFALTSRAKRMPRDAMIVRWEDQGGTARPMPTYHILTYPGCLDSSVWGWHELFALAGRKGSAPWSHVSREELTAQAAWPVSLDLLLVPAALEGPPATGLDAEIALMCQAASLGTTIGGVCAGVFLLARSGGLSPGCYRQAWQSKANSHEEPCYNGDLNPSNS